MTGKRVRQEKERWGNKGRYTQNVPTSPVPRKSAIPRFRYTRLCADYALHYKSARQSIQFADVYFDYWGDATAAGAIIRGRRDR